MFVQMNKDFDFERLDFGNLPKPFDLATTFSPFVCAAREFTCRCGPSGWPMAGVGCFVVVKPGHTVHALLLDISMLQESGMHEYAQLEKALEHKRYRTWRPTAVRLTSEHIMWVPYGMLCMPSTTCEVAAFMVIPWMDAGMAEATTEDVWRFISGAIIGFCNKNETKSPWKTLLPAFRSFNSNLFVTS